MMSVNWFVTPMVIAIVLCGLKVVFTRFPDDGKRPGGDAPKD